MNSVQWVLIVLTLLSGTQASALSCLRPDVAEAFNAAAASEDAYVVVHGRFKFTTPPSRDTGNINAPREVSYIAQFDGRYLAEDGFRTAPSLPVTVTHTCTAAWCGQLTAGVQTLAYLKQTATGYSIDVGPCGGQAFAEPSRQDLARVEACMRGDRCERMTRLR